MADPAMKAKASHSIFEMITFLKDKQKSGGFSQEDILFLLKKWVQIGENFEKGGDPQREGANYFKFAKDNLLEDYKADPTAIPPVQSFDSIGNPPSASLEFYKKLNFLFNMALSDDMIQRSYAFNDAEGAFFVMIAAYRTKLAANRNNEAHFRNAVARLRHAHSL
jgi:hypothetical protein